MSAEPTAPTLGPRPVSVDPNRWRPARMGLVNVWQYTDEVLEFEKGRMVLFGPNGSGKTMALELLLPHLLDARGQPGRLSTAGGDRGGLWDRVSGYDPGEPRTGYLWLELTRDDGASFTMGVRLRAKPSGGGDKHWFTTTQRIGMDLTLLGDDRIPLSVEALASAVEGNGKVWGRDTDGYRLAVREKIFPGWSESRLEALVRTLLVVRKQNVSDGLSTRRLSELLSEALPPLDDHELGRVADGFADLDRRRDFIDALEADVRTIQRVADANRAYSRAITARTVAQVVGATTAFDNVARQVRALREQREAGEALERELDERAERLEAERARLGSALEGLRSSEAYKHGAELDNLQKAAERTRRGAERADVIAGEGERNAELRQQRALTARQKYAQAKDHCQRARDELKHRAEPLGSPSMRDVSDESVVPLLRAWTEERAQAIRAVRTELQAQALAVQKRAITSEEKAGCEATLASAEEALSTAKSAAHAAHERWIAAVASWREAADLLAPHLPEPIEPATAVAAVARARSDARDPIVTRRSETRGLAAEAEAACELVREELAQWRAGRDPEPEAPEGRRDRSGLEGAPLWRLIEFRAGVAQESRDGLEAALGDSLLLDAWIAPDGSIALAEDESDLLAVTGEVPRSTTGDGRSLRDLIAPDPAADAVQSQLVERLLASIAVVDRDAHALSAPASGIVVGEDGSWRSARLAGRAAAANARYIGASSRAAFRRAKIASLEHELSERELSLADLRGELEALEVRLARCDEEAAAFPATREMEDAERALATQEARVESAANALHRASERVRTADEAVRRHQEALVKVAMTHALPTDSARLDEVDEGVSHVRQHISAFERCLQARQSALEAAEREEEAAQSAERQARSLRSEAIARSREHEEAASLFATVEESVGADYRSILERIRQATGRQAEIATELKQTDGERRVLARQMGEVEVSLESAEQARSKADDQRTAAGASFSLLCDEGLVQDADVGVQVATASLTSGTAILETARQLRARPGVGAQPDEARVNKLAGEVMARIGEASRQLAGRAELSFEPMEREWFVLRAHREGAVTAISALLRAFSEELEGARTELTRRQQELFEKILSGSVREHLKERLWAAQELVDRINDLLGNVQTASAGVRVELRWEIDPDLADAAELRQAKQLLIRDSPIAEGRAELDAFLRERIELVRADQSDTGEWKDRLGRMLDYRSWHRFQILVHHARFGERPRPLDSRKVSLSAGEKTIVMVLPLIAAVTAHYEPHPDGAPCEWPRLLLMDELFPKLDTPNKRQLLGLLPTLDLDAVFTSDKDRCEYDSLDGIAIHVFQKLEDDKTTTTRLVWNGARVEMPVPRSADLPPGPIPHQGSLLPLGE